MVRGSENEFNVSQKPHFHPKDQEPLSQELPFKELLSTFSPWSKDPNRQISQLKNEKAKALSPHDICTQLYTSSFLVEPAV